MATKYWGPSAGGSSTGTWDASSVTNWFDNLARTVRSTVAPTSADDVVFDAASDNGAIFTVTVGTGAVCRDITAGSLDFAMTLAGSVDLAIYGSALFPASNFSCTKTSTVTMKATSTGKTVTTNGVNLNGLTQFIFDGIGGEWTLGSALTIGGNITITNGSFITNNYNLSTSTLSSAGTATRSIQLGSSTVSTFGSVALAINPTGLTFNAGTSTFNIGFSSPRFIASGLTFYNVTFVNTSSGTITGANTFNNLSVTSLAATGIKNISIGANQTVNGTLTLGAANTAIRRMFVCSDIVGTPRTITLNGSLATLADVDFRDIVAAGTVATPWTGTRLGNCLGNSNITFDAAKTVYRVGTGNWSATQWKLSGGSVDVNQFPLAQDTAIFDTGTTTGTHTVDAGWNIGTLDMSSLTVAVTLATGTTTPTIYGNLTLDADVTLSGTGNTTFAKQGGIQTITSAGRTFTQPIIVDNATGTFKLADAFVTTGAFGLTSGNVDLNNQTLTAFRLVSTTSIPRSILFGTSKIILTGNNTSDLWTVNPATNFSCSGNRQVDCTYNGATGTRTITHGLSSTYSESNVVSFNITGGTDSVSLSNTSGFKSLNFTGFSGSLINVFGANLFGDLTVSAGMTIPAIVNITTFLATTGTQTITSNGKTLDFPITKAGAGTLQLQDALTLGSTRTFTHTAGAVDLNAKTLTVGAYSSTGAVARDIKFNNGSIVDLGAWTASGTNYTTSGTGSISMTSASAKTFAGGGFSYPTLNQGGAGDLTITGANRFKDMTNTVVPCVVKFPASTDTNVENFSMNGTPGNLVSIASSTPGTRFRLNKVAP